MASTTSVFIALTAFRLKCVYGYYCDSDKCSDDEYCCGYNLCCNSYKVWDLWYFWCGVLFFIFLLSLCGCIWRLRSRGSITGYNYSQLTQSPPFIHTCPTTSPVLMSHAASTYPSSRGNPPPYSNVSTMQTKASAPPPYCEVIAQRDVHTN